MGNFYGRVKYNSEGIGSKFNLYTYRKMKKMVEILSARFVYYIEPPGGGWVVLVNGGKSNRFNQRSPDFTLS